MANRITGYYLNEGKGASTRPNSRQALERTAIELRYGIYDKVDYDLVADATQLDITHLYKNGVPDSVQKYVPTYSELILKRKEHWHKRGLWRYTIQNIFLVKEMKLLVRNALKKIT